MLTFGEEIHDKAERGCRRGVTFRALLLQRLRGTRLSGYPISLQPKAFHAIGFLRYCAATALCYTLRQQKYFSLKSVFE